MRNDLLVFLYWPNKGRPNVTKTVFASCGIRLLNYFNEQICRVFNLFLNGLSTGLIYFDQNHNERPIGIMKFQMKRFYSILANLFWSLPKIYISLQIGKASVLTKTRCIAFFSPRVWWNVNGNFMDWDSSSPLAAACSSLSTTKECRHERSMTSIFSSDSDVTWITTCCVFVMPMYMCHLAVMTLERPERNALYFQCLENVTTIRVPEGLFAYPKTIAEVSFLGMLFKLIFRERHAAQARCTTCHRVLQRVIAFL